MTAPGPDTYLRAIHSQVDDVRAEVMSNFERWGQQNHPDGTGTPLDRRIADLRREVTQLHAESGTVTWRHILAEEVAEAFAETDPARLREELCQVAAVALAWMERLEARTDGE